MAKTKKTRKPQINCCAYDDYDDHNEFLYSTFTEPEEDPTMNETHIETDDSTETYSYNIHISPEKTKEGGVDDNEVNQTINQLKSLDDTKVNENVDVDAEAEIGTKQITRQMDNINNTPKLSHSNDGEEEKVYDDTDSLFTADIDDITINDAKIESLELDFSDVLIVKDPCDVHSDSSAILIDEETKKANFMSGKDEVNSNNTVDDWDVLSFTQNLVNQDSLSDWDAISSVQSVMSVGTFHTQQGSIAKTLTYKDILSKRRTTLEEKSQSLSRNNNGMDSNVIMLSSSSLDKDQEQEHNKCTSSLLLPRILENENSSLSTFDAYHELEGYKYSRGGKNPYQFRRNRKKKNQKKAKK